MAPECAACTFAANAQPTLVAEVALDETAGQKLALLPDWQQSHAGHVFPLETWVWTVVAAASG